MALSELKSKLGLESWHFQYDNPTFLGWSVVAVYTLAALCCVNAAIHSGSRPGLPSDASQQPRAAGIWWLLALALLFLGVNKQANFQTMMIVSLRHFSYAGGWWDSRRPLQLLFATLFGAAVGLVLFSVSARYRDFFNRNRHVFWGAVVLGVFVALRAASINHADEYLRIDLKDEHWAWTLEILGSLLIAHGARQFVAGAKSK